MLISDKVDSKPKLVIRHKEVHFILITGTEEEITSVNLYLPKVWHPTSLKIYYKT
jgi:hypothetical protein